MHRFTLNRFLLAVANILEWCGPTFAVLDDVVFPFGMPIADRENGLAFPVQTCDGDPHTGERFRRPDDLRYSRIVWSSHGRPTRGRHGEDDHLTGDDRCEPDSDCCSDGARWSTIS